MAVSREIYRVHRPAATHVPENKVRFFAYITTALLALFAIYVVMGHVVSLGKMRLDDVRYGRPRTFHLTSSIGPTGQADGITHFIAMNLNRQVMVFVIPGDDMSQVRTLKGPYLFGAGEDLTPVTIRMQDFNSDSAPDLVLKVKDEEVVYIYRDGNFSLITMEERQMISQQH